jgi:hypothetical protein
LEEKAQVSDLGMNFLRHCHCICKEGHRARAQRTEDHRRLTRALQHLKRYTDVLINGRPPANMQHMELHWDSWWDNGPNLSGASLGPALPIPRPNTGRYLESMPPPMVYQLPPITPNSKSHHTGADSADSVASSLSSCGSSIPPASPGDLLYRYSDSDARNSYRDRRPAPSPPTTPPCTIILHSTSSNITKTLNSNGKTTHHMLPNTNNAAEHYVPTMPPPSNTR